MLPGSLILANDEFPPRNALGKGLSQPIGCLLGLGLVNRRIAVRPPLFRACKHAPGVGAHLAGEELIDRCPPASCSGFINNRARIVPPPPQAEAAVPVDMPVRAERRERGVSRKFAHRYLIRVETQGKVDGMLRPPGADNRYDGLSALGGSMKRGAVIRRHALEKTARIEDQARRL